MKLLYLGTAAAEGIPALFCECETCMKARQLGLKGVRSRSGAVIDRRLKIDFGPDSYRQMLDNQLSYAAMHSVIVTHSHEDHIAPDELALRRGVFAHINTEPKLMTVYGNTAVGAKLEGKTGEMLAFKQIHAFEPQLIDGYTVTALEAAHCINRDMLTYPISCRGQEYHRSEEAFIYLIEKDSKRILYAHDTDELSPADYDFLAGRHLDLVSLDCTNGRLESRWVGHMGADLNRKVKQRLTEIGAADESTIFVANHFSHNGYPGDKEMQELLPDFVIAYDGMEVEV